MKTGKVEYSPDYASHANETAERYRGFYEATKMHVSDWDPVAEKAKRDEQARIAAEYQRLQSAVVEKARTFGITWRAYTQDRISSRAPSGQLNHVATEARIQLCDAVNALIAFEAEHKIGEK